MRNLVGHSKYFKFNSEFNRKPMEIFKNRRNVADFGETVTTRAAAFCTRWSRLHVIRYSGKPYGNELQ